MEIRVLRYFLALAREKTITGAAKSLHITQPTLSKQLMELEDELGKKLFIRGNRGITLTEDGIILKKRAEEIIELVEKTEAEIKNNESISGDIYIGGAETHSMRLIAKVLKKFEDKNQHIECHLYSGNADDVMERLDKGLLDFGILIGNVNIKNYNYLKLPATDTWGLLMKKDSPLAHLDAIEKDDLKDVPLICSAQYIFKNEVSRWFGKDFENLNIVATYNLIYNASLLVEEDIGYALCLDKLINTQFSENLTFKPLKPKLCAQINIVWKKSQVFSKAAQEFLKILKEEIDLQ